MSKNVFARIFSDNFSAAPQKTVAPKRESQTTIVMYTIRINARDIA